MLANMDTTAIRNRFEGQTALHIPILNHSDEIAEVLAQKMRVQDPAIQETGMVMALVMDMFGEMQDMESLLGAYRSVVEKVGREGISKEEGIEQRTALYIAAGFGKAGPLYNIY